MRTIDPKGYGALVEADRDAIDAWLVFHGIKRREVCLLEFNEEGESCVTRFVVNDQGQPVNMGGTYVTILGTQPKLG